MVGGFLLRFFAFNARFFAVQIEKTDKNSLQKKLEKKAFLLFTIKRKTICESLQNSYGALTAVIKILCQLSQYNANCSVIFYLCMRTVLDLVVSLQVIAFVLVKFSLCLDKNVQENFLLIFILVARNC